MVNERALREVRVVSRGNRRRFLREQSTDSREAAKNLLYRAISAARITMAITSEEASLAYQITDSLLEMDATLFEQRLIALPED